MTPLLTEAGYRQTQKKLANMEARLAALDQREDISPIVREEAAWSYRDMIRQYRREMKLYEAYQRRNAAGKAADATNGTAREANEPASAVGLPGNAGD